jgi:hypothetical protein
VKGPTFMPSALIQEVVEHLEAMPQFLQEQVLSMVRALDQTPQRGVAGSELLRFAGMIPSSDLDAMRQATERGCEQVDLDEW